MTTMILDRHVSDDLIRERKRLGLDRLDEVWDGVYMIMPLANVEHQDLSGGLVAVFRVIVDWQGLGHSFPGVNVSDRADDWTKNYRCPDVAVYLACNPATRLGAYWLGGPDFAVEIVSPDDRARDKLGFYASVGTRELLIIDRDPWRLELYRLEEGALALKGACDLTTPEPIGSEILPLRFRLVPGTDRPRVQVHHATRPDEWLV